MDHKQSPLCTVTTGPEETVTLQHDQTRGDALDASEPLAAEVQVRQAGEEQARAYDQRTDAH